MWFTPVPQLGRTLLGRFLCKCSVLFLMLGLVAVLPFAVRLVWAFCAGGASAGMLASPVALAVCYGVCLAFILLLSLGLTKPRAHRAKYVSFDVDLGPTRAGAILAQLCDGYNMPPHKRPVLCMTSRDKFAYSVAGLNGRSLICISSDVKNMDDDALKAVLAHELGHIVHHDSLVSSFALAAKFVLSLGRLWAVVLFFVGLFTGHALAWLVTYALLYGMGRVYNLLFAIFSRAQEYLADAAAARAVGWDRRSALIRALIELRHVAAHLTGDKDVYKTMSPSSLRSHPTWRERARALHVGKYIKP